MDTFNHAFKLPFSLENVVTHIIIGDNRLLFHPLKFRKDIPLSNLPILPNNISIIWMTKPSYLKMKIRNFSCNKFATIKINRVVV